MVHTSKTFNPGSVEQDVRTAEEAIFDNQWSDTDKEAFVVDRKKYEQLLASIGNLAAFFKEPVTRGASAGAKTEKDIRPGEKLAEFDRLQQVDEKARALVEELEKIDFGHSPINVLLDDLSDLFKLNNNQVQTG